jgi:DNA replication protein DnaC
MAILQTESALLVGKAGTGKTFLAGVIGPISSAKRAAIAPSAERIGRFTVPP